MTNCLSTVILAATLLITLAPEGFSLMCHTCFSHKSWDDCLENSQARECPYENGVCLKVFISKLYNNSQQVDQFAKTCMTPPMCNDETCRRDSIRPEEQRIIRASHCDVECCVGDLCNTGTTNVGSPTTMFLNFYLMIFVPVISIFI